MIINFKQANYVIKPAMTLARAIGFSNTHKIAPHNFLQKRKIIPIASFFMNKFTLKLNKFFKREMA